MGSVLFDLEHLEKLCYDRSKVWATLLENVMEDETLNEIDIIDIDCDSGCIDEEEESSDELASMEDNESEITTLDTNVIKNIANATRFSLLFNKPLSPGESRNDEENQLIDIFNQTLPIITEHNRQLKEAGFDKILGSFDRKAIEDKVGSWLNRHNSLFGGHDASLCANAENIDLKMTGRLPCNSCRYKNHITRTASNDSDDSLQSGEMARYIRTSKAAAIKKSASTTTMIKAFRKARSLQKAPSDRFDVRHLRRISKDKNCYDLIRLRSPSNHKMLQLSSQKPRTKVFRKRTCSNSYSPLDSSSDSDCYNETSRFHKKKLKPYFSKHKGSAVGYKTPLNHISTVTKLIKTRRCNTELISKRRSRMFYCLHSKANSSSTLSSSNSFCSVCEKRRAMKKNSKFFNDKRPCKRESECNCCSKRKLCDKYKHVADTSTEEWFVENCSPKKPSVEKMHGKLKTDNSSRPNNENNKSQIKNEKTTVKEEIIKSDEDWELQMPIEESKELYEKEQKSEQNKSKKEKYKLLPRRVLKKFPRNQESLDIKRTKQKNKKQIGAAEKLVKDQNNGVDIVNSLDDTSLPTQNNANILTQTTEETFFTAPQTRAICNSTALSRSSQAFNRQISDNQEHEEKSKKGRKRNAKPKDLITTTEKKYTSVDKEQKIAPAYTVTSTTVRSPAADSTLTSSNNRIIVTKNEINGSDHNDCDQVTSTTNIELPFSETITEMVEEKRNLSTNSNSKRQSTLKRYLIYAPENQNTPSIQSFSNDGYFTISKEHLSSVLGEKSAKKFLKYYVGRKRFKNSSTVYYRPPRTRIKGDTNNSISSSSADELDNMGQYGDLYESLSKAN